MVLRKLPGDVGHSGLLDEMLRVDHAGEYGATWIYKGQLAALGKHQKIEKMAEQEKAHLQYFENELLQRRIRPSILSPLWKVGGFALGFITAKLGEKSAMACTEAVESVISDHYKSQIDYLKDKDVGLANQLNKFREEEIEHHDIAIEDGARQAPLHTVLTGGIKLVSKIAIELAKKF